MPPTGPARAPEPDDYFVTGATGFIGRHLVARLLVRHRGVVHVLVRERSLPRFAERCRQWGAQSERVRPVAGDLDAPRLGLDDGQLAALRGRIAHVFHVAGLYDMTASRHALERANAGGTRHALEAAAAMEAGRFHHVSSIAVAGRYHGTFGEDMFDEATGLGDPYFRSKHEAEAAVRSERRLPWRIYRPALVVGHSETGEIDKADGPYVLFPVLEQLAAALPAVLPLPGIEGGYLNLVPVDFVAAAIDHLAHRPDGDGRAFHLVDPEPRTFGETLDVFTEAAGAPRFSLRANVLEGVTLPVVHALLHAGGGLGGALVGRLLGIPPRMIDYLDNPTTFDCGLALAGLADSDVRVPPLASYARRLWDYWERNLNADPSHDRRLERAVGGKRVLVTGASAGIGRATAIKLAAAGARVLLVARGAERLGEVRALIERLGGEALVFPADLTDGASVERLCREVDERVGGIDVLVNNAGRSIRRSLRISEDRPHDFARTMEINYFGAVRLIMGLLPGMRARRDGHIVNVSSVGVQVGPPRFAAYVASKAALDGFTRCAAPELIGDGIDVTTVYMPLVKTDMSAPTRLYDSFSAMTAGQAADLICWAIIRRPRRVSTWTGLMGQLSAGIAPHVFDLGLHFAYRLFPDSAAARGEKPVNPERPSGLGTLFAHVFPGIYW